MFTKEYKAPSTAGTLLDKSSYDPLLLAIWTFIAGGLYGAVGYFLLGFGIFFGARLMGSLGSFRRERRMREEAEPAQAIVHAGDDDALLRERMERVERRSPVKETAAVDPHHHRKRRARRRGGLPDVEREAILGLHRVVGLGA